MRRWIVVAGIALAAAALAVAAGTLGRSTQGDAAAGENAANPAANAPQPADTAGEAENVQVTVDRVAVRPIQRAVQVVGSFSGYDEVTVMAEATGRVVRVFHDVGDVVTPGDVLLKVDPTDYQLAIQEIWRSMVLDATRVGVPIPPEKDWTREKVLALIRTFDIGTVPTVLRARDQEKNAETRRDRARRLLEQKSISQETYELMETEAKVASNNRAQAELDVQAVVAGIRYRLAQLAVAEKKLRDTDVVVPAPTRREGMPAEVQYSVAQRKVTEGEMVKDTSGASTAVFELVMDKVLKLQGNVPERYSAQVKVGQKAEIRVDAYPGRKFEGKISRVSPVVDRVNRTFPVEILVPNPARELRPGGFAKADILTHVDPQALTVPLSALVTFVGSTKVFVVRDGVARVVPVTTGVEGRDEKEGSWVELVRPDPRLAGRGTQVVTSGQNRLVDGTPVSIRRPEAPRGPSEQPPSPDQRQSNR